MPQPKTLLFGAIGTLTESSHLQLRAFNAAFTEHGLDWAWSQAEYLDLLRQSGGAKRIADYAAARGETVDAAAIHQSKIAAFERMVADQGLTLRPGIADLIAEARLRDMQLGFVTTTSQRQIDVIAAGLQDSLSLDVFQFVGNRDMVANAKPAPDIYHHAMTTLNAAQETTLVIEDTASSAQAACAAGLQTFVYRGDFAPDGPLPAGAVPIATPIEVLAPNRAAA